MKTSLKLAAMLAGLGAMSVSLSTAHAQPSTIGEGDQCAWTANAGWIDFIPSRPNAGDGVRVHDTNRPRFDMVYGVFTGYAWSANCGWVNLDTGLLKTDSMIRLDAGGDGIADTWERERAGNVTVLTGTGDADGDGISAQQEYLLDTNPLVPNSAAVELEWPSSPARVYDSGARLNLSHTNWLYLDTVAGAAGVGVPGDGVRGTKILKNRCCDGRDSSGSCSPTTPEYEPQ